MLSILGWIERLLSRACPSSFAADADRLQRFEHEARVLGALNHPNLLSIFDVGTQDGIHYLVSEFLEGQTLRERLSSGPLPQRRSTDYAMQIASGLSAAHDKGIVHRDLKPVNVFVTRDERVKDSGLWASQADACNRRHSGGGNSNSGYRDSGLRHRARADPTRTIINKNVSRLEGRAGYQSIMRRTVRRG